MSNAEVVDLLKAKISALEQQNRDLKIATKAPAKASKSETIQKGKGGGKEPGVGDGKQQATAKKQAGPLSQTKRDQWVLRQRKKS